MRTIIASGVILLLVSFGNSLSSSSSRTSRSVSRVTAIKKSKPFEQRIEGPRRGARRMNHKFQHLYRHLDYNTTSIQSVSDYFTDYAGFDSKTVEKMMDDFPRLKDLSLAIIHPNFLFLKHTLHATQDQMMNIVPPTFFGMRLESSLAPKHAFLQHFQGIHGNDLLSSKEIFQHFLQVSRNDKAFCSSSKLFLGTAGKISYEQLQIMTTAFGRGLMAAARKEFDDLPPHYLTHAQLIHYLIDNGANPHETDIRGATLLHWAAGAGHIDGYKALLHHLLEPQTTATATTIPENKGILDMNRNDKNETEVELFPANPAASRDGATPLHWAAAGVEAQNFGCGGHLEMCQYILEYYKYNPEVVNARTKDDNSVLMWAAWSGSLDICKLLIRHRASVHVPNRNGCTVAHWAASGGNLELCQYLHAYTDVDFHQPNFAGNTPLSHAVAYKHAPVVQWLLQLSYDDNEDQEKKIQEAGDLAWDFVQWQDQDDNDDDDRQEIYDLFAQPPTISKKQPSFSNGEEDNDWFLRTEM